MKKSARYILLCCFFIPVCAVSQYQKQVEQLKNYIKNATEDSSIIRSWFEWDELIYVSNPDLDLELNTKIIDLCEKRLKKTKLDRKSRYFYEHSLSRALNNKGLILSDKNQMLEALDLLNRSYKLAKKQKNYELQGFTINNMGTIYRAVNEYKKALKFYREGFEITSDSLNNPEGLNNMGLCYSDLKDTLNAMKYFRLSLKFSTAEDHRQNYANTLLNMADVYRFNGMNDKALDYYYKALESNEKISNPQGETYCMYSIGNILRIQKQYKKAVGFAKNGLKLATKNNLLENKAMCSKVLYETYKDLNRIDSALYFYEKYVLCDSEYSKQTNNEELIKKQFYYEYKNKEELQKTRHKKEMELVAEKSKRQKVILVFFGIGSFIIGIFSLYIFRSYKKSRKMNAIIEHQKELVENKNQEILDSISYAKRLQDAVLPSEEDWFSVFKNSFIYYVPKDIVAGDFYWMKKQDNSLVFAVADCTGHGVPGAMVSLVCSNALNRVVETMMTETKDGLDPGKILDQVKEQVIDTFSSKNDDRLGMNVNDGMDISLGVITKSLNGQFTLKWSGANNPIYVVRKKQDITELIPYKGDNQPIGNYRQSKKFTSHEIELQRHDVLYLFTDGFADQFGGSNERQLSGKKYKSKRMKDFILSIQNLSLQDQKQRFEDELNSWKGELEQVDDICIVGINPGEW